MKQAEIGMQVLAGHYSVTLARSGGSMGKELSQRLIISDESHGTSFVVNHAGYDVLVTDNLSVAIRAYNAIDI